MRPVIFTCASCGHDVHGEPEDYAGYLMVPDYTKDERDRGRALLAGLSDPEAMLKVVHAIQGGRLVIEDLPRCHDCVDREFEEFVCEINSHSRAN